MRQASPNDTPATMAPQKGMALRLALPLAVFAVICAVFFVALWGGDPSKLPSALIGKEVPKVDFPPVEGLTDGTTPVKGFTAADLASGEVTVVNFWASWCGPCVQEHPLLVALKAQTGVRIVGVNYKDQPAAARRSLGRYGNPFAAVGTDISGRSAIEWGVYGMPETFIVNGRGQIAFKHVGPISAETLESKIIPWVKAAAKPAS